jgi:hypothetical protein
MGTSPTVFERGFVPGDGEEDHSINHGGCSKYASLVIWGLPEKEAVVLLILPEERAVGCSKRRECVACDHVEGIVCCKQIRDTAMQQYRLLPEFDAGT